MKTTLKIGYRKNPWRGVSLLVGLLTASMLFGVGCQTDDANAQTKAGSNFSTRSDVPYPYSPTIPGIELDWSTHKRFAQGSDNFQLAWAADDNLYGAWGDGGGFGGTNSMGRVSLGVARIEGDPDSLAGFNAWGGFEPENPATFKGKSWGTIALGKELYMWVIPDVPDGLSYRNHYEYVELAVSDDYSATWKLLDFRFHSSENLTSPTFLNYGRAGAGAPGRFGPYIYSYFIRPEDPDMEQMGPHGVGLIVHKPGAVYLARTLRDRFPPAKTDFNFFTGLDQAGQPTWGTLEDKVPVFEDVNGTGWCLSACYHPGLDRVLLATEHTSSHVGLLGLFEAVNPWGPWKTVVYHDKASPFGAERPGSELDWANNVFYLSFPTKWFDGDRFTISFTGGGRGKDNDSFNIVSGRFVPGNPGNPGTGN